MIVDLIFRVIVIAISLICAIAATVVALAFTLQGPIADAGRALSGPTTRSGDPIDDLEAAFNGLMNFVDIIAAIASGVTLTAALGAAVIAVLLAELMRIRTWLYHVPAGGVAMAAALAAGGFDLSLAGVALPGFAVSLVAAGFVGGGVYWLLAGRRAGLRGFR